MAVERTKNKYTLDIGEFINKQITVFDAFKTRRRAGIEARFQERVLVDGISYEEQLKYREEQLKKESDSDRPDQDFIADVKSKITDLKQKVEYKTFQDAFTNSFNAWQLGRKSADDHLKWLEETLADTTNMDFRDELGKQIQQTMVQMRTDYRSLVDAKIDLAKVDGTAEAIAKGLEEAKAEKSKALLENDPVRAQAMDNTIKSLERDKTQLSLNNTLIDIDMKQYGGGGLDSKLDGLYNAMLSASTENMAITVGGKTYANARAFWQDNLNNFAANEYFKGKEEEMKLNLTSINNKVGNVSTSVLSNARGELDAIAKSPALVGFEDKITALRQNVLMHGIDYTMNNLNKDLQLNDTTSGFNAIKDQVQNLQTQIPEISQSSSYRDLEIEFAKKQRAIFEDKINSLISLKASEIQKATDNITLQKEQGTIDEAAANEMLNNIAKEEVNLQLFETKKGFTDIPSSEFGFGKSVDTLLTNFIAQNPGLTTPMETPKLQLQGAEKTTQQGLQQVQQEVLKPTSEVKGGEIVSEGGYYRPAGQNVVYKMEQGKLRPLAGDWTGEQFKTYAGKDYASAVKEVPNITGFQLGQAITTPAASEQPVLKEAVPAPSPITAPTPSATPDPYASIKQVFGSSWTPAPIFEQKGLTKQGIYGAVRVEGMNDVYTIGTGGKKETAESYLKKFGTAEQKGIVGVISADKAKLLGIKI